MVIFAQGCREGNDKGPHSGDPPATIHYLESKQPLLSAWAPAAWQLMDNAARYTNEEHSALLHREAFDSIHGTPKGEITASGWFLRTILTCLASGAAGAECGAPHGKAISFDHFVGASEQR